jgi:photosystem II stability/assembly factor-like uncharacterized protein
VSGRLAGVLSCALVIAGVTACGGGREETPDAPTIGPGAAASGEPGLQHIHGLGVAGNALLIATHSGLWTAPEGVTKARRVGHSRQDIMGFSVVDEHHFVGSGHPDPRQNLPPNLGLIESRDGGRSWTTVSLSGQADFHVLETSGSRVYGFDVARGRLLVSADGGRSWDGRPPPGPMLSLAIDPRDRDHVVASTDRGLFASQNAGEGWRPLQNETAGLLSWPSGTALLLVTADGAVRRSRDVGRTWTTQGNIGGQPAAFVAHRSGLYAALHDGTVKRSTDGGRSWTLRASP